MSVRSAFNSIIKNIQRGSKTLGSGTSSATQTITAVVDGKTLINHLGQTTNNTAEDPQHVDTDLTFVNTTTISFWPGQCYWLSYCILGSYRILLRRK